MTKTNLNPRLLHRLASLYGLQTAYYDVSHRRQPASMESLLATLRALGAPLTKPDDIPSALREHQRDLWHRPIEPVLVAWGAILPSVALRLPSISVPPVISASLHLEDGSHRELHWKTSSLPSLSEADIDGQLYLAKPLSFSINLPHGYHRLTLELPGRNAEVLIISAPVKAYLPPDYDRAWGAFLPLYALETKKTWNGGDFSALVALAQWVGELGGSVLGTLPLLAATPQHPSPYLPVSRCFWNEFFLDISSIPELQNCPSVRALLSSAPVRQELSVLRSQNLVDYSRQMALKRLVLEELCSCFFSQPSQRLEELGDFVNSNSDAIDYARFRAVWERQDKPWQQWPESANLDFDGEALRYHLYAQWLARQQMQSAVDRAKSSGVKLYLDLPLGAHPDGYDTWRERDLFVHDASVGAPPDAVFTTGQDWAFPPLHPQKMRQQGYRYFIRCVQHNMRHAGLLRIDHVMGLHRLYWIPNSIPKSQGVYVHYPTDELYAILNLESHRNRCILVGEDLGTVPPVVPATLRKHGWQRMYVLHYEMASASGKSVLHRPPTDSVASLNTHDMPPFSAFWQGLDIDQWLNIGLIKGSGKAEKQKRRELIETLTHILQRKGLLSDKSPAADAFKACLSYLASSPARLVLLNLEDLWHETAPQNIPGTTTQYPNWRHKARYSLGEFSEMGEVRDILKHVNHLLGK